MNSTMFIIRMVWSIIILSCMTSDALGDKGLLINCGVLNSTNSKSLDGRVWQSDNDLAFDPMNNLNTVSTSVAIADAHDLPYKTARVFWSDITYTLSITPGPKFIRLYFYPNVTFNNTLPHQFSTSLSANDFILLQEFNPYLNSPQNTLKYEFQIILQDGDDNLNLRFSPGSPNYDNELIPSSYGYVNGIEIESIPEGLYINKSKLNYVYVTDTKLNYTMNISSATFQTAYRVNVGGENVEESEDNPGGMKRRWEADDQYVVGDRGVKIQPRASSLTINYTQKTPPYVAPKVVYGSTRMMGDNFPGESLMWMFEVDPGFDYVVRLHWCELDLPVTRIGDTCVCIGGNVAQEYLDIWAEVGGFGIPMYKDYVVTTPGISNGSKVALSVALQPHNINVAGVSLNGLEILKLSDGENLAVPNPPYNGSETIPQNQTPPRSNENLKRNTHHISIIIGGSIGCLLLVFVILLSLLRCRVKSSTTTTKTNCSRPSLSSDICRRFSLNQIKVATRDFDQNSIIGRGGFGKVYRGSIDGGATDVAVKRLNPTSKQGEHEFLTEIEMLSRLRHIHLVSLIGYCDEKGEMILIYEYMPRGTLRDHLNYRDTKETSKNEVLSWKQRLAICLGSARGLEYLHVGTKQLIIHRDVKSTNILLDDKWTAKVSDFGLSKVGPASDTGVAHVSTTVKGSFGYLDPDYYQRGQLTEKSDIYSFGVMLFEVLCAQPAVELNLPKVRACYTKGILYTLVDPTLTGQITPECLTKFGEIAELCVRVNRDERPSMRDIVWSLESMLTLQQTAENNGDGSPMVEFTVSSNATCGGENGTSTSSLGEYICESRVVGVDTQEGSTVANNVTNTTSHMDVKSGSVFSEIFDLRAR